MDEMASMLGKIPPKSVLEAFIVGFVENFPQHIKHDFAKSLKTQLFANRFVAPKLLEQIADLMESLREQVNTVVYKK